jgi:copper chaperone CopZ
MSQLLFTVPDMDCQGCVNSITAAIHRLDAGASVAADLATKRVMVDSDVAADFAGAIKQAGFEIA